MAPTPQQLALIAKARRRRAEAEAQPAQSAPSNAPRTNIPARIGFEAGKAVKGFYDNARRPSTPEESAKLQAGFDERSADRRALASINMGSDGSYQTEGKDGLLRPSGYANPVDRDISKGITTSPIWGANAAIGAAESTLNLPSDTYNTFNNASAQPVSDAQAMRNVNRMPQLQARVGEDPRAAPKQAPIFDIPRVPMPEGMESVTAQIAEPIAQFILARKAIGKIPGFKGGPAIAHNAKDAAALGIGVSSQSRLSEMPEVQAYVQASGAPQFAKDFVGWLGETDPGNPLLRRGKLALEDFVLSSPFLIPGAVAAGKRAIDPALTPTNAGGARLGSQSPAAPQMAPGGAPQPQPSVAPVNAVPPTRPAQPGQSGAGQQPPGAPPTLNATPQAVPAQGGVALAKSDAKIIGRLIRSGGVAGNDVNNVLSGLVQAYNRSNGGRTRLALFAEDYLPTVLPREVADGVIEQLRNFGNAANTSVKDGRRAIIQRNVGELRGSQEDYLTGVFEENLGDTSLLTTKGKIRGDKTLNADAVYKQELDAGQQRLAAGQGTPKEEAARDKLLTMMGQKSFFARIPDELKQAAEGNDQGLWELIHQRPLEAAHWLQSKLGFLERKKMDPSAGLYAEMRRGLLRPLEDAVPGYRGARMRAGDLVGQEIATKFGDDLFRAAAGELSAGEKAADFKRLSKSQQTVAKRSIRDKLKNEFRKSKTATGPIDPATGKRLDTRAAYMQQLQKDGVLEVLEEILGPEGKNIADAIRAEARLNDQLPAYGSDSLKNFVGKEAAREAVQSPLNKVVGDIGDKGGWVQTAVGDALLMANGLPPVLTAGKIGAKIVDRFGNPSKKALASATETLYGTPPPNAARQTTNGLASPPRAPRTPPQRRPAAPVTQATLDDLKAQYDTMNHGRAPAASEKLAKRIIRVRKQLEAQAANPAPAAVPPQNALGQSVAPTNGLSPSPKARKATPKTSPPEANGLFSRPKPEPQAPLTGGTPEAMARAREQGFDVDTPLYHGALNLDQQNLTASRGGELGPGVYVSKDPNIARGYAQRAHGEASPEGAGIMPLVSTKLKPISKQEWLAERGRLMDQYRAENGGEWKAEFSDKAHRELQRRTESEGYGGYYLIADERGRPIEAGSSQDQGVVFDPKNIRGKFAAFDPSKKDSSRLLDGMGGGKGVSPTILPELGGAALSGTLAYNAQPEGTSDGERAASIALSAMFGAGLARPVANRLGPAMKAVAANKAATRAGRNGLDSNGLFGMGGNQPGLKSAAIRYKDASGRMQVLKGKDHVEIEALADKKFAGQDMDTERGFIGSDGKFVKDMDAALDALSAGQITDPKVRAIIEQQIKAGRTPVITSEMLDFSGKARPESNGFFPRSGAEPNALKAAPKSQRRSGISIPRALVGGAVGGVMGAEADPQTADIQARMQGVNDRIAKIEREIAATESALKIYDTGSPKEVQAQLLRDGFDWVKQDEVIGPQTSRAIAEKRKQNTAEIAQKRADIEAERGRLKDLETQAAYAETAPSDAIKVLREAGPIGGAIAGLVLGALSRGGAVKSVAKKAAAQTNKLNALLTPGPVATPRSAANSNALARRAANVNEFWRLGGAGENVPFSTNGKGEWRPRSKAASPSSLFPSKTGIMKGGDYGVIASALAESGLATVAQQAAQQEIKAAQAAVDKNPTKENLERLENAKTIEAIATSAQRLGLALAGARATAALKMPYTAMRPDIGAAESERALILQAVRRAKPK